MKFKNINGVMLRKILAIGPFLGDFENELLQFRPYAKWLISVVKYDKIYLSTHINRLFLYDFVSKENIIPVYQHLSRDEINQNGYIHKKINKKDYNLILKTFKEKIIEKEGCSKKDIEIYYPPYTKNSPSYSIYNKIHSKIPNIKLEIKEDYKDKIIFIPAKTESLEKISYIYRWMKKNYNIIIVGDINTWFPDDNIILNKIDYFDNGFLYIIKYISNAKCVVCPLSHWTILSNMLSIPVFSWGKNPGQYRYEGIYNFGNKKTSMIPTDKHTKPDIIKKNIMSFIIEVENKRNYYEI